MVFLPCEFLDATLVDLIQQMIFCTHNNCKAFLQCAFDYAFSNTRPVRMILCTRNRQRVSLLCALKDDLQELLTWKRIFCTKCKYKVSPQFEFGCVVLNLRLICLILSFIYSHKRVQPKCFYITYGKMRKKVVHMYTVQAGSQRTLEVSAPSPAAAKASPSVVWPPSAGELPSPRT